MNTKLTIQEKLKDLRVERHLTLEQLAEETGLSKSALGKYESDDFKDISPFSIVTLAKFYGVSTDYLLGLTETKNHPNTDLHDLHLSDDMIDLLKSGRLNNRLLSELALHQDFQRFLVDIEIFVDRIADMRINDMNAILEANRKQKANDINPDDCRKGEYCGKCKCMEEIFILTEYSYVVLDANKMYLLADAIPVC